jgi:hypothetical protein
MSSLEEKFPVLAARAKRDLKAAQTLELLAAVEDALSDRARTRMLMSEMRQSDLGFSKTPAERERIVAKYAFFAPANSPAGEDLGRRSCVRRKLRWQAAPAPHHLQLGANRFKQLPVVGRFLEKSDRT